MEKSYKSVLFVEDSEADQLIARKIMQITGFAKDITIINSEQSTFDFLAAAKNQTAQLPEVIFLDARVHKSDSLQFLNVFKELPVDMRQNCKIVLLSDSDNHEQIQRFAGLSYVKKVIPKPLTIDSILGLNL